jgi:hypothetical protein
LETLTVHRKKKVREFPVPSRDVTTKLSLDGNNDVITELFLPWGSLVSDIPAGDRKLENLFLRCMCKTMHENPDKYNSRRQLVYQYNSYEILIRYCDKT